MQSRLMKKTSKSILLAVFSVLLTSIISCKKCTTCEVKDSYGNVIQAATETCGNSTEIDKAKSDAKNTSILIGGTYTCTDVQWRIRSFSAVRRELSHITNKYIPLLNWFTDRDAFAEVNIPFITCLPLISKSWYFTGSLTDVSVTFTNELAGLGASVAFKVGTFWRAKGVCNLKSQTPLP